MADNKSSAPSNAKTIPANPNGEVQSCVSAIGIGSWNDPCVQCGSRALAVCQICWQCRLGVANFLRSTLLLPGEKNMNFIIWLVVGGLIGWVASMIMRTDGQQGIFLNIIVGIVGAMLGGWLISPLVGVPTINQGSLSVGALVVSLLGAVILLAIVNLFRRGTAR
jgi:uncharacterized membrane protein YeaQ/YmgE (transglycosylase-associated protein family)